MNINLVSITSPLIEGVKTAEELITYCARVSNPSNQLNMETAPKLIKYLIEHKHFSPFEMISCCFEIQTTRAIAAQILRHRSFSFQEFCITGDSLITTVLPKNELPNYIPIKKLFDRRNWKSHKNIKVRVFDEKNKVFTTSRIKEVFYTGVKPVYEITLSDGKQIKCTKEHKFYTPSGFQPLCDIVGLDTNYHLMTKIGHIGVNGVPVYQSREWLQQAKSESITNGGGVKFIADKAKCSYHTIRKWLKISDLRFTQKEVASYRPIWNKNKFGYKVAKIMTEAHKNAIRAARSGAKSNWWKGGCLRSDRLRIADWCQTIRARKLKDADYSCVQCGSHERLELDHIIPVWQDKEKAYLYENIQVLCSKCHRLKHKLSGEAKIWRQKSRGNTLTVKFTKIEKIKFLGNQETFDLEVDHDSHNYVANKILVHNSQRYSKVNSLEKIQWRKQGVTNRQVGDEPVKLTEIQRILVDKAQYFAIEAYNSLVHGGMAKECARMVLPLNTETTLFMSGTLRSWIHYLELRTSEDTQKEHREIALAIQKKIIELFPSVSEALGWKVVD